MYVNIPYMDGRGMFSIVWLQATKIKVLVERLSVTTIWDCSQSSLIGTLSYWFCRSLGRTAAKAQLLIVGWICKTCTGPDMTHRSYAVLKKIHILSACGVTKWHSMQNYDILYAPFLVPFPIHTAIAAPGSAIPVDQSFLKWTLGWTGTCWLVVVDGAKNSCYKQLIR